jgi:putative molybdopterin biosynthesis protein
LSSKRKEFRELVSLEDAKKTLLPFYKRDVEQVPVGECHGRTLAASVYSDVDVPPFDRASMDGYAVKAKDTWGADEESPKSLKLTGIIHAGDMPSVSVEPGTAVAIATGAMMPIGANAVAMVENTDPEGGLVNVRKPVSGGENVMHAGADIMRGEMVLRNGVRLTFREIGALAAMGMKPVPVFKKPKVAIISTGNEIAMPGERLKPGSTAFWQPSATASTGTPSSPAPSLIH